MIDPVAHLFEIATSNPTHGSDARLDACEALASLALSDEHRARLHEILVEYATAKYLGDRDRVRALVLLARWAE